MSDVIEFVPRERAPMPQEVRDGIVIEHALQIVGPRRRYVEFVLAFGKHRAAGKNVWESVRDAVTDMGL